MKAQQEIVTLFFCRGDKVRYRDERGIQMEGRVEQEVNGRPGWYYVRDEFTGVLHLVMWQEMERL